MAKNQGRRADDISADEIKEFWHDFCERKGVDAVLNAAALTYVAAAITTLLTLLYYLHRAGLLGGRRD